MHTSTRVELGLYDTTAKTDAAYATGDAPAWNSVSDLQREQIPPLKKYGTLEPGQFWMDGSFSYFPDRPAGQYWGFWSRQMSGTNGRFTVPPTLTIRFSQPHSSAGMTFHFYAPTNDWARDMQIQWLTADGRLLDSIRVAPDQPEYYCPRPVDNYEQIILTFYATSKPRRYIKLTGLDYGTALTFAGEDLIEANLLEEIDPLSSEISINTLSLRLYSRGGMFSILHPDSIYDMLQQKQKITVWADVKTDARAVEAVSHNMGTFYLSDWSNDSSTVATLEAVDAVGLLDSAPFAGCMVDTTAGQLAAQILAGYDYRIAPDLAGEPVKGYIPEGTRREALHQLAFALGAVVDCSRSHQIKIYPPPENPSSLISPSRKLLGSQVKLRPLITSVAVTAHQYRLGTAQEELYKDTLPPGVHRITFADPVSVARVAGGTLLDSGCNFADIRTTANAQVTVTGCKYVDGKTVLHQQAANIPPNAKPNELQVTDATLVSPDRAAAVARRVLEVYADRVEQTFRMMAGEEQLADMLLVDTTGRGMVRGTLQKMEFDLTHGFIAAVKVVGQRVAAPAERYAGESFTGQEVLM